MKLHILTVIMCDLKNNQKGGLKVINEQMYNRICLVDLPYFFVLVILL